MRAAAGPGDAQAGGGPPGAEALTGERCRRAPGPAAQRRRAARSLTSPGPSGHWPAWQPAAGPRAAGTAGSGRAGEASAAPARRRDSPARTEESEAHRGKGDPGAPRAPPPLRNFAEPKRAERAPENSEDKGNPAGGGRGVRWRRGRRGVSGGVVAAAGGGRRGGRRRAATAPRVTDLLKGHFRGRRRRRRAGAGGGRPALGLSQAGGRRRKRRPPPPLGSAPPPARLPVTAAASAHVCETSPAAPGVKRRHRRGTARPGPPPPGLRGPAGRGRGPGRAGPSRRWIQALYAGTWLGGGRGDIYIFFPDFLLSLFFFSPFNQTRQRRGGPERGAGRSQESLLQQSAVSAFLAPRPGPGRRQEEGPPGAAPRRPLHPPAGTGEHYRGAASASAESGLQQRRPAGGSVRGAVQRAASGRDAVRRRGKGTGSLGSGGGDNTGRRRRAGAADLDEGTGGKAGWEGGGGRSGVRGRCGRLRCRGRRLESPSHPFLRVCPRGRVASSPRPSPPGLPSSFPARCRRPAQNTGGGGCRGGPGCRMRGAGGGRRRRGGQMRRMERGRSRCVGPAGKWLQEAAAADNE